MNHRYRLYRLVLCSAPLLVAVACGDAVTPTDSDSDAKEPAAAVQAAAKTAAGSGLGRFTADNICDILPVSVLQEKFGAPADLTGKPYNRRGLTSCSFSWPRPDAKEREQALTAKLMENMQKKAGERSKMDMRALSSDYTLGITLKETKVTPANFVPAKLSEEQLQKRIDQTTQASNKRLTEEQKSVLGKNGVSGVAGKMIRMSNERVVVEGIGDAAYWMPIAGGSLSILADGYQFTISPNLADDDADNIEAAREVAKAILR